MTAGSGVGEVADREIYHSYARCDEEDPSAAVGASHVLETQTATIPTKQHDGSASRPRKRVRSTTSSSASSRSNSTSRSKTKSTPAIPWPEPFKALAQTHRALNLVYTFCCARKHFATTFENIKAAVEAQTGGRQLSVEDVAKVKVLIPRAVRFEAVDPGVLDITSVQEAREQGGGKLWQDWEAENVDNDVRAEAGDEKHKDTEKDVLLFEFVDGDLRKQKPQGSKPRKSRDDDIQMPVYNQKQMLK